MINLDTQKEVERCCFDNHYIKVNENTSFSPSIPLSSTSNHEYQEPTTFEGQKNEEKNVLIYTKPHNLCCKSCYSHEKQTSHPAMSSAATPSSTTESHSVTLPANDPLCVSENGNDLNPMPITPSSLYSLSQSRTNNFHSNYPIDTANCCYCPCCYKVDYVCHDTMNAEYSVHEVTRCCCNCYQFSPSDININDQLMNSDRCCCNCCYIYKKEKSSKLVSKTNNVNDPLAILAVSEAAIASSPYSLSPTEESKEIVRCCCELESYNNDYLLLAAENEPKDDHCCKCCCFENNTRIFNSVPTTVPDYTIYNINSANSSYNYLMDESNLMLLKNDLTSSQSTLISKLSPQISYQHLENTHQSSSSESLNMDQFSSIQRVPTTSTTLSDSTQSEDVDNELDAYNEAYEQKKVQSVSETIVTEPEEHQFIFADHGPQEMEEGQEEVPKPVEQEIVEEQQPIEEEEEETKEGEEDTVHVKYCICGVVWGVGGDMVQDYEEFRKYKCMRYTCLKVCQYSSRRGISR